MIGVRPAPCWSCSRHEKPSAITRRRVALGADRRQQRALADRHRDVVVVAPRSRTSRRGRSSRARALRARGPSRRAASARHRSRAPPCGGSGRARPRARGAAAARSSCSARKLARACACARAAAARAIVGEQVRQLVAERGDAARLEPDDRDAGRSRLERAERRRATALGQVEHAVVVERAAAAQVRVGHDHVEAGVLEHVDRRVQRLGEKWLLNVSAHRMTGARRAVALAREAARERARRERRDRSLGRRCPATRLASRAAPASASRSSRAAAARCRAAPSDGSSRTRTRGAAAGGARSSATGTRTCTSPCRRARGSRPCSPCRQAQIERVLDLLARPAVADDSPCSISNSMRARPRVECFSSCVTM